MQQNEIIFRGSLNFFFYAYNKITVSSEESWLGIDLFGNDPFRTWWVLEDTAYRTFSHRKSNVIFSLLIETGSEIHHFRSTYSALDMLGDVGGLKEGLNVIGSFAMAIYSLIIGDPLEAILLGSLFKVEGKNADTKEESHKQKLKGITDRKPFVMKSFPICTKRK